MSGLRSSQLTSCLCTERTMKSEDFQNWAEKLKEGRGHLHRKIWEWCFICQALYEHNMLAPGREGLGFAVGEEPLTSVFAQFGARIVATDLCVDDAIAAGWVDTQQHASGYEILNKRELCDKDKMRELVSFQFADMNNISHDFEGRFDFVWSSCALEHLGTLEHGKQYIVNSMKCLKPGGVAVHTTEYNISSNYTTVESGDTVLYRRRDINDILQRLRLEGYVVDINWDDGEGLADGYVDVPPYKHLTHLKLQIDNYIVTSIGLIIKKPELPNS